MVSSFHRSDRRIVHRGLGLFRFNLTMPPARWTPFSNDELRHHHWDPQALNLFLEEKYIISRSISATKCIDAYRTVAPSGNLLSSSSLFPVWRESPDKPVNEEEKTRANQLSQFTQRKIFFGVYPTEIFDSLSLGTVFFYNQTLRFPPI